MSKIKSILAICLLTVVSTVHAAKTITLMVGFPPGSGNDLVARQLSKDIAIAGGPNIVVENKIGVGGNIAVMEVVNSSTPKLLLHSNSLYFNSLVTKTMTVDLQTQLVPVSFIGTVPMIFETSTVSPIRSIEDVVNSTPGQLTYGSGGIGSLPHANMAYISYILKTPMVHVPYQGSARSLIDLTAGRIDLCFDFYNSSIPFIQDNRLRPLAVTGNKRLQDLPDVPTLKEKGIDWPLESFYMLFASANFDQSTLDELRAYIVKILKTDPAPYIKQGIQIDFTKLVNVNKFHTDTITHYKNLDFPLDIKNEKP